MANKKGNPNPRWVKGVSGNPGGRPKKVKEVAEYAKKYTIEAIDVLVKIMRDDSAPETARIRAAEVILDRGLGKPVQSIVGEVKMPERIVMSFPGRTEDERQGE